MQAGSGERETGASSVRARASLKGAAQQAARRGAAWHGDREVRWWSACLHGVVVVIARLVAEVLEVCHKVDVTAVVPAPADLLERIFHASFTDGHRCEVGTLQRGRTRFVKEPTPAVSLTQCKRAPLWRSALGCVKFGRVGLTARFWPSQKGAPM